MYKRNHTKSGKKLERVYLCGGLIQGYALLERLRHGGHPSPPNGGAPLGGEPLGDAPLEWLPLRGDPAAGIFLLQYKNRPARLRRGAVRYSVTN